MTEFSNMVGECVYTSKQKCIHEIFKYLRKEGGMNWKYMYVYIQLALMLVKCIVMILHIMRNFLSSSWLINKNYHISHFPTLSNHFKEMELHAFVYVYF